MIKNKNILLIIIIVLFQLNTILLGESSTDKVVTDSSFVENLKSINDKVIDIKAEYFNGNKEKALIELADYFSLSMSKRYFFSWKNFNNRLKYYSEIYSSNIENHIKNANVHMNLFNADTKWNLPMISKSGKQISAYELRHLARQHKSLDIMFTYYNSDQAEEYINYLTTQLNSLAEHYYTGDYEKKGNAIFEVFRAGYRMFNWLFLYNSLLASPDFTWRNQIDFIKTFYYHTIELQKVTSKFHFGNHQTKGLMSQTLISILFPEFKNSSKNLAHSLKLLTEHLTKEVNEDGFQFERSVHYHIGDINNYLYVYRLAQLNNIALPNEFISRFKMMFDALAMIAMPNKKLPVLQDDTDSPWAEYNNMGSVMLIGSIIFNEPRFKYFADKRLSSEYYWFFKDTDIEKYYSLKKTQPENSSTTLQQTGYYVFRNGWKNSSDYMIISAGLSNEKPDHQHGDMLGIYAYANSNVILPNYQTRYSLKDYKYFKSSFVKNIAIVDSISQGVSWKGNRGGSGFGKWLNLPKPSVITWKDEDTYSLFIGTHNGYKNYDVSYYRAVLFVKDGFYIVLDNFANSTQSKHNFQQIWQGNYSIINKRLLESSFQNGSGLDIYQLNNADFLFNQNSVRGKGSTIISSVAKNDFSFATLLFPFKSYEDRIIFKKDNSNVKMRNWEIYKTHYESNELEIKGKSIIADEKLIISLATKRIKSASFVMTSNEDLDLLITYTKKQTKILSLNSLNKEINFKKSTPIENETVTKYYDSYILKPGETIRINN